MNSPKEFPLTRQAFSQPANYPHNLWWYAARADEVLREKPLGLWLLDQPVVLYRKLDGTVVALDNRCPHRWAPLSEGKVDGDNIVCPYHGFKFCPAGDCVEIPTQATIPSKAKVKAYPVIERDSLVWIWMGDPDLAATQELPLDTAWLIDPDWSLVSGFTSVDANYQLLKENILDLTHLPHVHPVSIGASDWNTPPKVETTEETVGYRLDFPAAPLPPVYGIPTGLGMQTPAERSNWGTSYSPAAHRGFVEIRNPNPKPGERETWLFSVMHLTTPESPTRFRYQWYMGWNVALSEEYLAAMRANVPKGYAEDKFILEQIQQMILRDPRHLDHPEIIVQADQAAIQSRRKLGKLLAQEQADK
ncbi:MAG: aromatic ring-hydroxylating dioxygenase subunit alpha [Pseudomonadota bacterium]